MFNWFRRRGEPRPQKRERARSAAPAATPAGLPADFADTAPLPRVVAEGNSEADWSMWEDSMITLDSHCRVCPQRTAPRCSTRDPASWMTSTRSHRCAGAATASAPLPSDQRSEAM